MSQIETRLALFRLALAGEGRKLTRERETTARVVFDMQPPIDPELLVSRISRSETLRISRATVYRTLHDLERLGLLPAGAWMHPA